MRDTWGSSIFWKPQEFLHTKKAPNWNPALPHPELISRWIQGNGLSTSLPSEATTCDAFIFLHNPFLVCSDGPCFLQVILWRWVGLAQAITRPQALHLSECQILITHAQYIIPAIVPSFTFATSITSIPQLVRTLCIAPTTCKVGYDCNTHTHNHAWSLH